MPAEFIDIAAKLQPKEKYPAMVSVAMELE